MNPDPIYLAHSWRTDSTDPSRYSLSLAIASGENVLRCVTLDYEFPLVPTGPYIPSVSEPYGLVSSPQSKEAHIRNTLLERNLADLYVSTIGPHIHEGSVIICRGPLISKLNGRIGYLRPRRDAVIAFLTLEAEHLRWSLGATLRESGPYPPMHTDQLVRSYVWRGNESDNLLRIDIFSQNCETIEHRDQFRSAFDVESKRDLITSLCLAGRRLSEDRPVSLPVGYLSALAAAEVHKEWIEWDFRELVLGCMHDADERAEALTSFGISGMSFIQQELGFGAFLTPETDLSFCLRYSQISPQEKREYFLKFLHRSTEGRFEPPEPQTPNDAAIGSVVRDVFTKFGWKLPSRRTTLRSELMRRLQPTEKAAPLESAQLDHFVRIWRPYFSREAQDEAIGKLKAWFTRHLSERPASYVAEFISSASAAVNLTMEAQEQKPHAGGSRSEIDQAIAFLDWLMEDDGTQSS